MAKTKSTPKQETKVQVSRDAGTGQFVPKKYADSHPKTTISQTIKKKKS